jgi:hypothetical protein
LSVQTNVGRGDGVVRLVQEQGVWKVFTLFTYLKELKGHEERVGRNRPNGVEHGEHASQRNWLDRRKAEENFEHGLEPTVIIMGGFYLPYRLFKIDVPIPIRAGSTASSREASDFIALN